jgi:hypothetical protein
LFILLLALALNPVLALSQFGNLEFMRIFGKGLYFQIFFFENYFLKITNPGKNLIFLLKNAKI